MSHYYQNDPNLKSDIRTVRYTFKGQDITLNTDMGVFSKTRVDFGTNLLLNSLTEDLGGKSVLDIGCGYGIIGIAVAKAFPESTVEMADINDRAVLLALENARANHLNNTKIYKSHLYEEILSSFDVILSNPPIRAGKEIVHGIAEEGYHHLKLNGIIRMVIQKKQGALSLMKKMEEIFSNVTVITKEKGYYILESRKL